MYKKFIILNIDYIIRSKVRDYLSNIEVEELIVNLTISFYFVKINVKKTRKEEVWIELI